MNTHKILLLVMLLGGCREQNSDPLPVRTVLSQWRVYNRKVVTIRGCYQNGVEQTVIGECKSPRPEDFIWVVPYTQIENTEKVFAGYRGRSTATENPSAEERARYQTLRDSPNGKRSVVVVRGEIQCENQPQYGNGPGYKCELILYRVLSIST